MASFRAKVKSSMLGQHRPVEAQLRSGLLPEEHFQRPVGGPSGIFQEDACKNLWPVDDVGAPLAREVDAQVKSLALNSSVVIFSPPSSVVG